MRFMDFVQPELILVDLESSDTNAIVRRLVQALVDAGAVEDYLEIYNTLCREETLYGSWAFLGNHNALPHTKSALVDRLWVVIGTSSQGIEWSRNDGELVHVVCLVVRAASGPNEYLRFMEDFCRIMRDETLIHFLRRCRTPTEVYELLQEAASDSDL